ncbi:MAG: sigma-70 family RNA polymerase sigma factor [Planctomycetota bacterium]|jgi:RNA polymerase sigma-70 factor (ECF subfamily)
MSVPVPNPEALLEHAGFIRSLAYALTRDEHVAEDVVQQTYLAAIQNPPSHATNLRSWLGKVARNFAFRAHRSDKRLKAREGHATTPEPPPTPEDVAARLELQRLVVEAVMGLDEPYRSTVVLRFFDDCPPDEIARRMGVPKETVRTRLRRALVRMRERLDTAHGGKRAVWVAALLPLAGTREATAAAAASTATAAITGGLIVSTKLLWTAAAAALAIALFFIWTPSNGATTPRTAERTARVEKAAERSDQPDAPAPPEATAEPEPADTRPTVTLRGIVVDEHGEPIAGATIETRRQTATSDEGGHFAVTDTFAGFWMVTAKHADYVPNSDRLDPMAPEPHRIALRPGAALGIIVLGPNRQPLGGVGTAASIRHDEGVAGFFQSSMHTPLHADRTDENGRAALGNVAAGTVEILVDDLRFAPVTAEFHVDGQRPVEKEFVLDTGGVLLGEVTDAHGDPIAGAEVYVANNQHRSVKTGADGRYRLEKVGRGPNEVLAKAKGHGVGYFGSELGWDDPVEVHVRTGEVLENIDIRLPDGLYVTGRVLDRDAKPVEGVNCTVHVPAVPYRTNAVLTGKDGRFRVGPYARPVGRNVQAWFHKAGYDIPNGTGTVKDEALLDLGDILCKGGDTVKGRVVDTDGEPVSGARVWLNPGRGAYLTNGDGRFETRALPPGRVRLFAEFGNHRSRVEAVVTDEVVDELELVLRETGMIRGRVQTPDGKPRSGITVGAYPRLETTDAVAYSKSSSQLAETDAEGNFALGPLPDHEFEVRIGRKQPRVIARPGSEGLVLTLPRPGGGVTARIVSAATGKPVRSFQAQFISYKFFLPDTFHGKSYDDAEGRLGIELQQPGTWAVQIDAPGFAKTRTNTFPVKAGETTDLGTIRLGLGGRISGVVTDHQGQPVPFARIHFLTSTLDTNRDPPFTDAEGRYEIRTVAEGVYNVFAVSPRHPLAVRRNLKVKEGETARLDFQFGRSAPLTVTVLDEGGQPVAGAELTYAFAAVAPLRSNLFRGYEPPGWGLHETGADGIVVKPFLPATKVKVYISRKGFRSADRTVDLTDGEAQQIEFRLKRNA